MSYILEALRKAERERQISRVPTLAAAHGPDAVHRRSWPWPWAAAGAVVLGVVVAYLVWTPARPGPREPTAAAVPSSGSGELRPPPPSPAAPSAPPLDRAPAVAPPSGALGIAAPRAPDIGAFPPAADPPVARRAPAPTVAPPSGAGIAPPRAPDIGVPTPAPDPPVARTEVVPPPSPIAPRPGESPSGRRVNPVPEARVTAPPEGSAGSATGEARLPPVPPAAGPSPEPAPGRPARPAPAETVPRFTLDVLVYSDAPAERLVFINGRKYVEGQAVDEQTVVEQITPDGAVLRHAERRFVLSPKLNPYAPRRLP